MGIDKILEGTSPSVQTTFQGATPIGIGAKIATFAANPALGLGLGVLGLIGKGIGAWSAARAKKKAKKENKRRWEATMQLQQEQFAAQEFWAKRKHKMSKMEFLNKIRQQTLENKERLDATNYERAQSYANRLTSMLGADQNIKKQFANMWST